MEMAAAQTNVANVMEMCEVTVRRNQNIPMLHNVNINNNRNILLNIIKIIIMIIILILIIITIIMIIHHSTAIPLPALPFFHPQFSEHQNFNANASCPSRGG